MAITCNNILNMPLLSGYVTLMAGENGLKNPIRWTHVLESLDAIKFLQGSELVFITGIHIKDNTKMLVSAIEELAQQHIAGLVINTGMYIHTIPPEAMDKANQLELPLFSLPWKLRLVDVTKQICESIVESEMEEKEVAHLLEKILFSDEKNYDNFIRTAEFYGYDLSGPLRIANVYFPTANEYMKQEKVNMVDFRSIVEHTVNSILELYAKKRLSMWKGNNLIMVVPVEPEKELMQVEMISRKIKTEIFYKMKGLNLQMGLGGEYMELAKLKRSYAEAEFALKLVSSNTDKGYVLYRNTGIYKFLNKINDKKAMNAFYEETLGKLIDYDRENNTNFTDTLRVYLEESQNTNSTIQKLFIHRNTLKYRLKRIEEILNYSLNNSEENVNLQIAFKIKRFLELGL